MANADYIMNSEKKGARKDFEGAEGTGKKDWVR